MFGSQVLARSSLGALFGDEGLCEDVKWDKRVTHIDDECETR